MSGPGINRISNKQIRQLRKSLGRTQIGMASIIGVSAMTWARWEKGQSSPLPVFREKLKKLLRYAEGEK